MDVDDFFLEGSEGGAVDGIEAANRFEEEPTRLLDEKEIVLSPSEANVVSFHLMVKVETRVEALPSLSTL